MEIYADPDLAVLLSNRHDVGYQVWVLLFADEAASYQFIYFSFDGIHDVWVKTSLLLLYRLSIWQDVKLVHCDLGI